jgi:ABC-type lipoprotein export system ATPase subunit
MSALLEISRLSKDYQGLRPLRIAQLTVPAGDVIVIGGIDSPGAETFVNLVTGATLADEGDVILFGRNTRDIVDSDAWLKSLDGIGMITVRGVLIGMFSVLQNIALSLTLEVDPIDPRVVPQAGALARAVGIDQAQFDLPAGQLPLDVQMRVHLARSLALEPKILIAEHASAALPRESVSQFGADVARVAQSRGLALIAITADEVFAKAIGGRRVELVPASGELRAPGLLKKLFG